ncbi:MAG TPA: hypothetical protein VGF40_13670 [Thermoanaerobaculia bacterium]
MKPRALAFLLIPLVMALAPPLLADESLSGPADSFREDFGKFLDDLGRVPGFPQADIDAARAAYDAATPEQQALIRARLETIPAWRGLPEIIASFASAEVEFRRQELARLIEEGTRPPDGRAPELENVERMRRTMLFMIDQLRKLSPVVGTEYEANLDFAAAQIATLPPQGIPAMYQMMGRLARSLEAGLTGEGAVGALDEGPVQAMETCSGGCSWDITGVCEAICNAVSSAIQATLNALQAAYNALEATYNAIKNAVDGFLSVAITAIGSLYDQVVALPTTIGNALAGLWGQIETFLTAAVDAVISLIPAGIEDLWGLIPEAGKAIGAIAAWINSAPTIPDLCPGPDVLSVVSEVCGRGAGELTALFVKLAPGDTVGLPYKVPLVLLDAGVQYLCMCADHKEAEAFDTAQAEHRTLTSTNLDQKLSLLATGTSVDALNLSIAGLDDNVELVEAKVDTLGTDAADLKAALLEEETYLQSFRDLLTRVKIEENLLENPPNVVSTYQLPESFGGMLGRVRGVVWTTFQGMESASETTNGALRELQRADALFNIGSFALAFEAYRSAYFEAVK